MKQPFSPVFPTLETGILGPILCAAAYRPLSRVFYRFGKLSLLTSVHEPTILMASSLTFFVLAALIFIFTGYSAHSYFFPLTLALFLYLEMSAHSELEAAPARFKAVAHAQSERFFLSIVYTYY